MSFSYYKTVTIDHTKVPSTQTNFPVLVSVTDADLKTVGNGGYVQNASGFDVGFYADSGAATKLDWETERYIASTGEALYWVRVPSVSSSTDTVIYLFFGDSGITTDQSNPTGVWDSNYVGVYHLEDGTTLDPTDSTSNANDGTNVGAAAAAGQIGGGVDVDGSSTYVDLGNPSSLEVYGPATYSGWFKSTASAGSSRQFIIAKDYSTGSRGWGFGVGVAGDSGAAYLEVGGSPAISNAGPTLAGDNTLHAFSIISYGSVYAIYLDGAFLASVNASVPGANGGASTLIGRRQYVAFENGFEGVIDEIRISDIDRSADWIEAEYNNQSDPSTFLAFGSRTAAGGGDIDVEIAEETDSALALSTKKAKAIGLNTETDSAQAMWRTKLRALGLNTETASPFSIGHTRALTLGLVTETDAPFSIGRRKASTLGQPTETGSALSFVRTKRRTLGIASESDICLPMGSPGEIDQPVELVTETDEAFSIARVKRRTCGLALEACSAFSLGHQRARALGIALETDSALAFVLPTPPVTAQLRVAFLDRHGRFAKDTADVTEIRVFRTDDPDEYTTMTAAAFKALTAAQKTSLYQAGSAAGLIDTSHKSNA